ncbi:Response regulator receiver [Beggiatoa sp. PS]|nr:Response regulator receiver [Beggiatoa sp. PS]
MKLVRKKKDSNKTSESIIKPSSKIKTLFWKILIVDDEPDIHSMTRLSLKNFQFAGKNLQIFEALSGAEAQEILANEPDIAVALIDVVMETDDAGLQLVDFYPHSTQLFTDSAHYSYWTTRDGPRKRGD